MFLEQIVIDLPKGPISVVSKTIGHVLLRYMTLSLPGMTYAHKKGKERLLSPGLNSKFLYGIIKPLNNQLFMVMNPFCFIMKWVFIFLGGGG